MTFVEEHLEQHVDEVEQHRDPEKLLKDNIEAIIPHLKYRPTFLLKMFT